MIMDDDPQPDWSGQQQQALESIQSWITNRDKQVFRLFGYAGTGKSTLARFFGAMEGSGTQYAAFTGKAALVMRRNGCMNASTIHSLIYEPYQKGKQRLHELEDELHEAEAQKDRKKAASLRHQIDDEKRNIVQPGFTLKPKEYVVKRYDRSAVTLLIIDEVSMVNEQMGRDLLSFGLPILVLGDPAQLPPVIGTGFFTEAKPDIMLTEIHRQAAGNPIISLATTVREGGRPYDIIRRREMEQEEWLAADQILVGLNRTRHYINGRMREWLGFSGTLPMLGERVICLRNNQEYGLLNGSMWKVEKIVEMSNDIFQIGVSSLDENRYVECEVHTRLFHEPDYKFMDMDDKMRANEFDFGYAITTHKAQGSQWNNVIYIDEWPRVDTIRQHRYTGVTRAVETIKVVKW